MSFRAAFVVALRAAGVADGLVLDALLAAEASERERRAAARAARLSMAVPAATKPDSGDRIESGLATSVPRSGSANRFGAPTPASAGGPLKDRARRGVVLGNTLKPAAQAVAAVLIERFNLSSGQCNPGVPDIAAKAGLSQRSVRRALAELDARGLIVRIIHGAGRSNAYRPDWDALAALAQWPAAKMNKPDSVGNRTPVATKPDTGVRQNLQGNIQSSVTPKRSLHPPDRRQGSLLLPIPGKAAVASSSAEARLWRDVQEHFGPQGARAFEAVTLRLMDGGLGERAAEAEQSKRGDGLRMVLNVLREAG